MPEPPKQIQRFLAQRMVNQSLIGVDLVPTLLSTLLAAAILGGLGLLLFMAVLGVPKEGPEVAVLVGIPGACLVIAYGAGALFLGSEEGAGLRGPLPQSEQSATRLLVRFAFGAFYHGVRALVRRPDLVRSDIPLAAAILATVIRQPGATAQEVVEATCSPDGSRQDAELSLRRLISAGLVREDSGLVVPESIVAAIRES